MSPVKFLFCTDKIDSIEWQDLVPRLHIGDCFEIHLPRWGLCYLLLIKSPNFSARGTASPVRLQGALVILVRKHTSPFRSFGKWEKILCFLSFTFVGRSESESWEMCAAGAGTSVSSRFSVNSFNHSGRPRNRSSEARLMCFFLFLYLFFEVICSSFLELVRHFVTSLLGWTWRFSWRVLRWRCRGRTSTQTIQGQQEVQNCQFCTIFSSPAWSTVVFDRWPTHRYIRVLRRVFQAIELQAYLRAIAQSRRDQDRVCLHFSVGRCHRCGVSWISAESTFRLSLNSFCWACALMPQSQPRKLVPLDILTWAPAFSWLQ